MTLKFNIALILGLIVSNKISAQSMHSNFNLKNQKQKIVFMDSTKFNIMGNWEIIDIEFFDDSNCSEVIVPVDKKKFKIDRYIGETISFMKEKKETHSILLPEIIFNPIYIKSYKNLDSLYKSDVCSSALGQKGTFFSRFGDKTLTIEVKCSSQKSFGNEYHILNENLIMYLTSESAIFMQRVQTEKIIEWQKDKNNYYIIKGSLSNGAIEIELNIDKFDTDKFIEIQIDKNNINNFYLSAEENKWCKEFSIKPVILSPLVRKGFVNNNKVVKKVNRFFIPLTILKTNILRFDFINNSLSSEVQELQFWELKYKIIDSTSQQKNQVNRFFKIKNDKVYISKESFEITKMYLLKNDEVEILEEKDEWIKIRYYGKKTIEGWIKKSDVGN